MLAPVAENWAKEARGYFADSYGLQSAFALSAARLYVALHLAGLRPRITSGFRDGSKQAAMRAAWDAGNRQGLRVRPADPSKSGHCKTGFLGRAAAQAIDMPCADDRAAARIAEGLGLRAGINFTTSDPGHYDAGAL